MVLFPDCLIPKTATTGKSSVDRNISFSKTLLIYRPCNPPADYHLTRCNHFGNARSDEPDNNVTYKSKSSIYEKQWFEAIDDD